MGTLLRCGWAVGIAVAVWLLAPSGLCASLDSFTSGPLVSDPPGKASPAGYGTGGITRGLPMLPALAGQDPDQDPGPSGQSGAGQPGKDAASPASTAAAVNQAPKSVGGWQLEELPLTVTGSDGASLPWVVRSRVWIPKGPGPFPLLVFLHGAGERGVDNQRQLTLLPKRLAEGQRADGQGPQQPHIILAVQCPPASRWVETDWSEYPIAAAPTIPSPAMQGLIAKLGQVVGAMPVDRSKILLTGLSMGGFGAWHLAARHPDWFAGVVPVCGGGDPNQAARLVGVPIWAWHGGADPVVPVDLTRDMVRGILAAGGEAKYTELPDLGHGAWTPAYGEDGALEWLFQQRLKNPARLAPRDALPGWPVIPFLKADQPDSDPGAAVPAEGGSASAGVGTAAGDAKEPVAPGQGTPPQTSSGGATPEGHNPPPNSGDAGAYFSLPDNARILILAGSLTTLAQGLADRIAQRTGRAPDLLRGPIALPAHIKIGIDAELAPRGFRVSIDGEGIRLAGADVTGVAHGIEALLRAASATGGVVRWRHGLAVGEFALAECAVLVRGKSLDAGRVAEVLETASGAMFSAVHVEIAAPLELDPGALETLVAMAKGCGVCLAPAVPAGLSEAAIRRLPELFPDASRVHVLAEGARRDVARSEYSDWLPEGWSVWVGASTGVDLALSTVVEGSDDAGVRWGCQVNEPTALVGALEAETPEQLLARLGWAIMAWVPETSSGVTGLLVQLPELPAERLLAGEGPAAWRRAERAALLLAASRAAAPGWTPPWTVWQPRLEGELAK